MGEVCQQIDADQFRKQRGLILRPMAQGWPCGTWKRLAGLPSAHEGDKRWFGVWGFHKGELTPQN
jgi:hypothetical protein